MGTKPTFSKSPWNSPHGAPKPLSFQNRSLWRRYRESVPSCTSVRAASKPCPAVELITGTCAVFTSSCVPTPVPCVTWLSHRSFIGTVMLKSVMRRFDEWWFVSCYWATGLQFHKLWTSWTLCDDCYFSNISFTYNSDFPLLHSR
jgi:hypothetical protein